jgi:glycosyltransferase involved in cell wall biosynthesis
VNSQKNLPLLLLMGQTPPPWHGQAVATQLLFDHDWPDFEVRRLRMEFSGDMVEVGRFRWKKVLHLFRLIFQARRILKKHPGGILFYPPASAKWIPFLRDVIFLCSVRYLAGATVFIYHASGLPLFARAGVVRRLLARLAYRRAEMALEVANEKTPPHEAFMAKSWRSCPCGIAVPLRDREPRLANAPCEVLFVGSLQEGKGVLELLKTAKILKERGRAAEFRFRIAGKWFSTEFEAEATSLLAAWGLGEMVEFVGQLTGDAKWDAYYRADLFFFPTHYASEATPIVLMEALGTGLPIVSTQWAGIPAMLEGCDTATLVPVRSPEKFAEAVESWHGRQDDAGRVCETSRQHYEKRFTSQGFIERVESALLAAASRVRRPDSSSIRLSIYLADQHPGQDRSYGISRMSQMVMASMQAHKGVEIETIVSATSQQAPLGADEGIALPWGTRTKWVRLLTDHVHPMLGWRGRRPDVYYFPKGYLPLLSPFCRPSAVTIHDTIVQYDADHYPEWRSRLEYAYWAKMLAHTLKHANRILTVSESAKGQIRDFMKRYGIPPKEITVTYEPCSFEELPQPVDPVKENYVIHLASVEPHQRTAHLIRCWHEAEASGRKLPMLQLVGKVPAEVVPLLSRSRSIMKRPFLEDQALQAAYRGARALIFPSEIEGFGLPALEAYYLGTPVCFVKGTSVEEVLAVATGKGGFSLASPDSLFSALEEVMAMTAEEIRECGLKLRETYAADKVCERMVAVFREMAVKRLGSSPMDSRVRCGND